MEQVQSARLATAIKDIVAQKRLTLETVSAADNLEVLKSLAERFGTTIGEVVGLVNDELIAQAE